MAAILLDQGLPLRAAEWLRNHGIDAVHAREMGLAKASDKEILEVARREQRICFTLDHDFHRILAETAATTPSVVLLRVQLTGFVEISQLIARVLDGLGEYFRRGIAVTATRRGIRLHSLPLK